MNKILFKLEKNGLINQLMSLEIAIGLAKQSGKNVIVHNVAPDANPPIHSSNTNTLNRDFINLSNHPKITDLVVFDDIDNLEIIDSFIPHLNDSLLVDGLRFYFYGRDTEKDFSYERINLNTLIDNNIYIQGSNVWYSVFFLNKDVELSKAIKSLQFKAEYTELAKKIAESIGLFNGVHIRLTDHAFWKEKPNSTILLKYINMMNNTLPLVVATDDSDNEIFNEIKDNAIFLDRYILDNYIDDFKSLEFHDESVFGLITNLVMHYSVDFVGSQGSTYSGYIQRNIYGKNKSYSWNLIGEEPVDYSGKYSFSNYHPAELRSWFREWKESDLS